MGKARSWAAIILTPNAVILRGDLNSHHPHRRQRRRIDGRPLVVDGRESQSIMRSAISFITVTVVLLHGVLGCCADAAHASGGHHLRGERPCSMTTPGTHDCASRQSSSNGRQVAYEVLEQSSSGPASAHVCHHDSCQWVVSLDSNPTLTAWAHLTGDAVLKTTASELLAECLANLDATFDGAAPPPLRFHQRVSVLRI
jgi:hypothetical protein